MGRCRCWNKWWFILIVVLCWIAIFGLIALSIYCGMMWSDAYHDYSIAKDANDEVVHEWQKLNETVRGLESDIKQKTALLESEKETLSHLQDEYKVLSDAYHKLEEQYGKVKADLDAMAKDRDKYKEDNEKLKISNQKTLELIGNLSKEIEDMKHEIIADQEEAKVFFWSSIGIGAVCTYDLVDFIMTDIALKSIETEVAKLQRYRDSFGGLSQAYEDYELLRWKKHQSIKRENCFQGTNRNNLDKCVDKAPTITTVTTTDGIKFGAVLFEKWTTSPGAHEDAKAYTFSDTLAQVTKIADSKHAMIVDANKLIEFGEGDIAVDATGTSGTAVGKTYTVPPPYSGQNFYYNGTKYTVGEVRIDAVTLA